ncbi:hypothetical protein DHEL01_v200368 [Diaporthe helianthi]|uniref:2EXR domain-containing protein n=1 Tax=Diaporthe helianthi TaxID=158607 RepID=A0A2P5IFF3_DIAHE|nr:hypothetical protein DHEL01_v200368 [Diaporthe helianthi]
MSSPTGMENETSQLTLSSYHSPNLDSFLEEQAAIDPFRGGKKVKANFNTLPAEVRVKIYKMTWEPRRVRLARSWLAGQDDLLGCEARARTSDVHVYELFDEDQVTTVTTSRAQLPVTLWVNSESRHETLRHYEIAFACPRNGSSKIYFNFAIDELEMLCHSALRQIMSKEDLARVRELIVPMGFKNARASYNTLDTLRISCPVNELDEKIDELHTQGLASGLEPYRPDNLLENRGLRRLAESLQQEIAVAQGLPPKLLSVCPSLRKMHLLPTAACVHWPTGNIATREEEDDWFLRGGCTCLTCLFHWSYRHFAFLVADDPEEQVWSVGDRCPHGSGVDREVRLGQLTISWRACVDAGRAWGPDDIRCTERTVADWAVAGTAVDHKLSDHGDSEPMYVL